MTEEPEPQVTDVPFAEFFVMPPPPGVCQACAVDHPLDQPHDQQSLAYQYYFRNVQARAGREERWPTWADAMAHCSDEVKADWTRLLREHGVEL